MFCPADHLEACVTRAIIFASSSSPISVELLYFFFFSSSPHLPALASHLLSLLFHPASLWQNFFSLRTLICMAKLTSRSSIFLFFSLSLLAHHLIHCALFSRWNATHTTHVSFHLVLPSLVSTKYIHLSSCSLSVLVPTWVTDGHKCNLLKSDSRRESACALYESMQSK